MKTHVPLHLHDGYSALDGFSTPEEYMKRAKDLGITHLAQTNHGTLAGHRHFQRAAEQAGVVPILGVEAYISATDRFDKRNKASRQDGTGIYNHIILLAQNENGLKNLQKSSEVAWTEGYYYKPRMDMDLLRENSDDIIVLSGCMNGLIAKAFERGDLDSAEDWTKQFIEVFGDRFYIELQDHNPAELNHYLLELADKHKIKPVITDDCHYADPSQKWLEEAFLILSTKPKKNKDIDMSKANKMDLLERFNYLYPDRTMTFEHLDIFLADRELREKNLEKQGISREDLFDNTLEIAQRIGDYPYYANLDTIPVISDSHNVLPEMCRKGMKRRGLEGIAEYEKRLEVELKVIAEKQFEPYFLIVSDALQWAKQNGIIVGPGRGSSAGSLVCYVTEITEVDPLKYGLLFSRFLDPGRSDWPDVDSDIQDDRRDEVKDYLEKKYGNVASISTFVVYKDKNALKDAASVMNVPFAESNKIMKSFEGENNVIEEFSKSRETAEFRKKYPDVLPLARALRGRIKSYGMHAAGVIISNKPVNQYVSVESRPTTSGGRIPVTGVSMDEASDIGLLKVDLLGLSNLRVIKDTIDMIRDRHGKIIDPWHLPLDDEKTYELLRKGLTAGVFQFEAASSTKLLSKIAPVEFNDLVITTSVVRSGAWKAIGEDYLKARKGEIMAKPIHESTRDFTEETLYYVVYQEQLMRLCTDLADMSIDDANKVRKITAKKQDPMLLAEYKKKFIDGASLKIPVAKAEKLWQAFEIAAEYMFNKSHAVAYMLVAYATAWLKANYPLEFMCSVLRNEKQPDKITDYLLECKNMGIPIRLPHVNKSDIKFSIDNNGIRFGLSAVKYISDTIASRFITYRPFESYAKLKEKVLEKGSGLNTRALHSLNAVGAATFDDNPLSEDYRNNLYEYLGIPAFESSAITHRMKENIRSLDEYTDDETFILMAMVKKITKKDHWARADLVDSSGSAGVFFDPSAQIDKGKMYLFLVANNSVIKHVDLDNLEKKDDAILEYLRTPFYEDIEPGQHKVIAAKIRKTKQGKNMATVVFSNENKELISLPVWPTMFDEARFACRIGAIRAIQIGSMKDGTKYLKGIA